MIELLVNKDYLSNYIQMVRKAVSNSDSNVEGAELTADERLEYASQILTRLQSNAKMNPDPDNVIVRDLVQAAQEIYAPVTAFDSKYSPTQKESYLKILENAKSYMQQPGINKFAAEETLKIRSSLALGVYYEHAHY